MTAVLDLNIMLALVQQVSRAANGDSERKVITIVTRPMWQAWCRALSIPEDSEPTGWDGQSTNRIYGSETVIVESEHMAAVSFCEA